MSLVLVMPLFKMNIFFVVDIFPNDIFPLLFHRTTRAGEADKMQRRGGKRIRMDDPPPEYESPMTPMTPMDAGGGGGGDIQEPYTPYTPYSNQPPTPLHAAADIYGADQFGEPSGSGVQFGAFEQPQYDLAQQQALANYDPAGQYEQPPTPVRPRVTRSRLRGKPRLQLSCFCVDHLIGSKTYIL